MSISYRDAARLLTICLVSTFSYSLFAAERGRQIEEIVVTAEKRESTVSDTSISITAFNAQMIEDLGIQSADELINYIPATTRDSYDIRIRGVGRNFRALGGDPGVATYYNGVYSPDFGIAASENALYDLERVEVLRGPQGTLYGRNSIGGALNYVTKRPSFDMEGEIRTQFGEFGTREYYGVISGPIIADTLAVRLVANQRYRDGWQNGIGNTADTNSTDDHNYSLALTWNINENIEFNVRVNDRESDRKMGAGVLLTQGPAGLRGTNPSGQFVLGLRRVDGSDPGAIPFTNPGTGTVFYGTFRRAGLDRIGWPFQPNSFFGVGTNIRPGGVSSDDPNSNNLVNRDSGCDKFPYTTCDSNHEFFGHRSVQSELTWDISDSMSLKYIFGHTDFDYTFNIDEDYTNVDFTKFRQTVLESVYNYSHELQLNWEIGDRFTATSGAYLFNEMRWQDFSLSNTTPRFTEPANYGALEQKVAFLGDASIMDLFYFGTGCDGPCSDGTHKTRWTAPFGFSDYGRWDGDPRGDVYHHQNRVKNQAIAFYTQGTLEINEQFQLVLGIRYAKDRKGAHEVRGGYSEEVIPWAIDPAVGGFQQFIWPNPAFGLTPGAGTGLTDLGIINIMMGNATWSGDPSNPLIPTCELTDNSCNTILRLGGVPISWGSNVGGHDTWSDTNYRVNLDWTPTDDILMYFSVTTGYRSGGYQLGVTDSRDQPRDPVTGLPIAGSFIEPLTYDKETVTSIEIGYKGMHLDNTLQVSASIYQYDYDGYQDRLNVYDPVRQRGVDIVQNANAVINRGFETEFLWLATDELTIGGNYSYTDAFYDDDYFIVVFDDPRVPIGVFGELDVETAGGVEELLALQSIYIHNAKDSQLKLIPKHKATVWSSYRLATDIGDLTFRGTYSYTGKMSDSGLERKLDVVPDRFRLDLSVMWRDPSQRWTVRAFVDNVTDEANLRGLDTAGEEGNWRLTGTHLYPRYWGLDVKYTFGG